MTKRMLNRSFEQSFEQALDDEARSQTINFGTKRHRRGHHRLPAEAPADVRRAMSRVRCGRAALLALLLVVAPAPARATTIRPRRPRRPPPPRRPRPARAPRVRDRASLDGRARRPPGAARRAGGGHRARSARSCCSTATAATPCSRTPTSGSPSRPPRAGSTSCSPTARRTGQARSGTPGPPAATSPARPSTTSATSATSSTRPSPRSPDRPRAHLPVRALQRRLHGLPARLRARRARSTAIAVLAGSMATDAACDPRRGGVRAAPARHR